MKWTLCAAMLLSSAVNAQAVDTSQSSPEFRAYHACMKQQAAKYGRKTDRVDDAIAAAKSACAKQGQALRDAIAYRELSQGRDPKLAEERVMKLVDDRMRPDLAKAALDSRP